MRRCARGRAGRTCPRAATRARTSRTSPGRRARPGRSGGRVARAGRRRHGRRHQRRSRGFGRASTGSSSSGRCYEDGSVARAIEAVRAGGHTYEKDGAVWLRSTDLGDDKDRVLVRSDGTPTYIAGDLATSSRSSSAASTCAVYVLGADHHGYIGRLKAARGRARLRPRPGRGAALPDREDRRGRPSGQLSKRRGTVLMLDELLDAIGVDAARYALVQRSHDQLIELDLDLWARAERREPGLLLPVRPRPHGSHPAQARRRPSDGPAPDWTPEPAEVELMKHLAEFPDVVSEAAERRGPHRIAGYAQETAKSFHQFYKQCRVLGEAPGRGAQPARALPRNQPGDGDRSRPRRSRGARHDVTCKPSSRRCYPEPP